MSGVLEFEKFVRDYQNMVFTIACRLLADEMEAQDIAQDVFLKAFECFDNLRLSPTAGGWLKTVTRNLCLNHLTRHRRRRRLFSELAGDAGGDPGSGDPEKLFPVSDPADGELQKEELHALLSEALRKLPQAQRVPLVLHYMEDMSCEAIARSLHVGLSKVKTDIYRGRRALRRVLSRCPEYGND
ncbi:MAG TPA: sigma-70 family RNA polymerase sigma factor [Acidobacteriota bacterium]|nr:sigma-70 family RNA polymerase sigma factor [Acidobacteriota bacterium]